MIIAWSFESDFKKKKLKIDERLFQRIGQDDMAAFEELYILTEKTIYSSISVDMAIRWYNIMIAICGMRKRNSTVKMRVSNK